MIEQQIARIGEKICAQSLRMNGCLNAEEIAAFEARYGVRLPEECRRFLLEIGNGGAEPSPGGLSRLGQALEHPNREQHATLVEQMQSSLELLRAPFPFRKAWIWKAGTWQFAAGRQSLRKLSARKLSALDRDGARARADMGILRRGNFFHWTQFWGLV